VRVPRALTHSCIATQVPQLRAAFGSCDAMFFIISTIPGLRLNFGPGRLRGTDMWSSGAIAMARCWGARGCISFDGLASTKSHHWPRRLLHAPKISHVLEPRDDAYRWPVGTFGRLHTISKISPRLVVDRQAWRRGA
jgi:hypothetical protein